MDENRQMSSGGPGNGGILGRGMEEGGPELEGEQGQRPGPATEGAACWGWEVHFSQWAVGAIAGQGGRNSLCLEPQLGAQPRKGQRPGGGWSQECTPA